MQYQKHSQVVVEVTVVDNSGVEHLGVRLHDLVSRLRDQASGLAVLRVDYGLNDEQLGPQQGENTYYSDTGR